MTRPAGDTATKPGEESDARTVAVCKFGGSVLADGTDLRRVVRLVESRTDRPVIVVSALEGVTDAILEAVAAAPDEPDAGPSLVEGLERRHVEALQTALPDGEATGDGDRRVEDAAATLADPLTDPLADLERLLHGVTCTGEVTASIRDRAASYGERLAARVVASALSAHDVPARAHDADELGVVTDGRHGHATAEVAATRERAGPVLRTDRAAGRIPVVTGYFGRGPDGAVTTFGRGGSDYTAAVLARALAADAVEVWKDVPGFLSADPDRLPGARPIPRMSYDEAAELAYLGVQVLHPRTLEPVRPAGVPVHVRHVARPADPGTVIGPAADGPAGLRAIDAREGFAIVRMSGSAMAATPGVGARIFSTLAEHDVTVLNMAASQASFALLVEDEDADRAAELIRSAAVPTVEDVSVTRGHALVCVVGQGLGDAEGVAGEVFSVLGAAGVTVTMISVGSSSVALSFVIDEGDVEPALSALHREVLEPGVADERAGSEPTDQLAQGSR